MAEINLVKQVYGLNTYTKAVSTNFTELLTQPVEVTSTAITVDQFFQYYDELFFNIPVSGSVNSHTYLVEKSQQYVGGSVIDNEKQALIEEINALRQQLLNINQSFAGFNNLE